MQTKSLPDLHVFQQVRHIPDKMRVLAIRRFFGADRE
jgi:hypothetical protein